MQLDFNGILVNSEDPKVLTEFYTKVFEKEPEWDMGGYSGWKVNSAFFTVGPHSEVKGKNADAPRFMVMLTTDDVKGEYERIMKDAGAKSVAEPYNPDENSDDMWLATLEDPDGNYFQLASPMPDMAN